MIIEIRNQLKSQGFKIVLWVTLIAMALLFSPALFRRQTGNRMAIATVNNRSIEALPFERKVAQETERLSFFREQFGPQAEDLLQSLGLGNPRNVAMQSLIYDELLNQAANDLAIHISPDYILRLLQNSSLVQKELGDIVPLYLFDENTRTINTMRLNQYLHRYRLSITDFEKSVEDKLKRSTVLSMVSASSYISPQDIKDHYGATYLGRTFSIAEFPLARFKEKAKKDHPTPEEIDDFFEKHNKRYWIPEKRSGYIWEFSPDFYNITIPKAEAEGYYHAKKATKYVETPLQMQVRRILIKVDDNADTDMVKNREAIAQEIKKELSGNPALFEQLAKQHSDDKASSGKGGLLDFFKKGDKDPEFERAAFRLKNDGDISDVIVTNQGFEILQRVSRKQALYKPFASVESEIVTELKRQKFKNLFNEDMSRFMHRSSADELIGKFALDKKANARTLTLQEHDNSVISEKLFKIKRVGDWVFFTHAHKGYALNLREVEKTHRPALQQVATIVMDDMVMQRAREAQQKTLEQAKKAAQATSFGSLKQDFGAVITKYGPLKKSDKEAVSELQQKGIPVQEMLTLEKPGSLTVAFNDNTTGYLIQLDTLEPFDPEDFKAKKDTIFRELAGEQQSFIERGFVASLYRNATIHFIESLPNKQEENLPYE